MKSIQLAVVILLLLYTEVRGHVETVRCEFSYNGSGICNIDLVKDYQQPISAMIFEIPDRSVYHIIITGGRFETFPDLSDVKRKFDTIRYLSIWNTGLKIVNGENLATFEGLYALNMYDNEISSLDANSFKELRNVICIYLGNNSLEILPGSVFNNNKRLNNILIEDNKLNEIHEDTFKELQELRIVNMSSNQLETLPPNIFRNNKELNEIFLQNNKLKAIDRDTFKGLHRLEELRLNDNQIEVLPRGLLDDSNSLSILKLHNNKLIKIESNLRNLQALKTFTLDGNVCIDQSCPSIGCNSSLLNELINNIEQRCSN